MWSSRISSILLFALAALSLWLCGCCKSYKSDVEKTCNLRETCPDALESPALLKDRERRVEDCLRTHVSSDEGREMLGALFGRALFDRGEFLDAEAGKVGLSSCTHAEDMLSALELPAAPAGCAPLSPDEIWIEIGYEKVMVGDTLVMRVPSGDDVRGSGFGTVSKDDPLAIVPLREQLRNAFRQAELVS